MNRGPPVIIFSMLPFLLISFMSEASENRAGSLNMFVALGWQVCLFITMVTLVWRNWKIMYPVFSGFLILSLILYFSWYRKLPAKGAEQDATSEGG